MTEDTTQDFVDSIAQRGGVWSWRYGVIGDDWWLDLNNVPDMTDREADEIARTAFSMRDAIRGVLLARETTVH